MTNLIVKGSVIRLRKIRNYRKNISKQGSINKIERQAYNIAEYYINMQVTMKLVAKHFGISVSTVWKRLEMMKEIDKLIYSKIVLTKKKNIEKGIAKRRKVVKK